MKCIPTFQDKKAYLVYWIQYSKSNQHQLLGMKGAVEKVYL